MFAPPASRVLSGHKDQKTYKDQKAGYTSTKTEDLKRSQLLSLLRGSEWKLKYRQREQYLRRSREVTKSRKPIKQEINIHLEAAVSTCRCICGVLGVGDQEVNMIESNSFISLMEVITACGDGEALKLPITCLPERPQRIFKTAAVVI